MKNPSYIQINIPQPCHEDWTQMTSQQQGRFCDSCQKCVVDFTNYTDTELHRFLQEHQGEKVCGRFKNTQLNRAINIPPQPHSTIYKWIVAAGLALVISALPNSPIYSKVPYKCEAPFEPQGRNGKISGIVTNIEGDSLNKAVITVSDATGIISQTTSDNGKFTVEELSPGQYVVEIQLKHFKTSRILDVLVSPAGNTEINEKMAHQSATKEDTIINIRRHEPPLIDKYSNESIITGLIEVEKIPTRNTGTLAPDLIPTQPVKCVEVSDRDYVPYRNTNDIISTAPGVLPIR